MEALIDRLYGIPTPPKAEKRKRKDPYLTRGDLSLAGPDGGPPIRVPLCRCVYAF